MSGLVIALIVCAYVFMALAVACFGVFGLAANRDEFIRIARERNDARYPGTRLSRYDISAVRTPAILATVFGSLLWPVGIPLWFAWKKGNFIAQALAEREALNVLARKESAA